MTNRNCSLTSGARRSAFSGEEFGRRSPPPAADGAAWRRLRFTGRNGMPTVSMTVNGKAVSADVEARTLLVQYLRENLGLTGTHVGCDTSQCGACVVHVDGKSVKSCTVLAAQAQGAKVTTIEGLAQRDGTLHPMQAAFREH